MEIEKNSFISTIKTMYENEKNYGDSLLRNAELRDKVFDLEKKVNYLKSENYDVSEAEIEIEDLKRELRNDLQNIEQMKQGNITLYNWKYVEGDASKLYNFFLENKLINSIQEKTIITHTVDYELLENVQNHSDYFKNNQSKTQHKSKQIYQIVFSFDENYTKDDNINIFLLKEINDKFVLLLQISYKDVIKFIIFNSEKEILSSNLKTIKNDNFLLKLIEIIINEADSKTANFKVNRSIQEINLALDEVFLKKKDSKSE